MGSNGSKQKLGKNADGDPICGSCQNDSKSIEMRILSCNHFACAQCVQNLLQNPKPKCPVCNKSGQLEQNRLYERVATIQLDASSSSSQEHTSEPEEAVSPKSLYPEIAPIFIRTLLQDYIR